VATNTPTETAEVTDDGGSGPIPLGLTLLSAAIAAAVLFPLVWVFVAAFDTGPGAIEALTRPSAVETLVNSLLLVGVVTACSILVGVPLAYLVVRTDLPFPRLWTVLAALPLVIPSYIGAFAFDSAFGVSGEFNEILTPVGLPAVPEVDGLVGTSLVLTLYTYPYVFLTTRAALLSMDESLVEAARSLGHSRTSVFRRVTAPQIRPAVAAGALLVALYTLSDFGTPSILDFKVFTWEIYNKMGSFNYDLAALLSVELLVVAVVILAVESRLRSDVPLYSSGKRSSDTVSLGKWRWPATLFPASVAVTSLVVPVTILLLWLQRDTVSFGRSLAFQWQYAINSATVAGVAAVLTALVGLPVAYLAARRSSRLSGAIERATYVGYAAPGVVLGLALVYFGARYGGRFYRTGAILLPLLIFAYVVRFLPQAVGSTRASILQVDPQLPEAARSLGRSRLTSFRKVTFPLVAPGLLAGAALVFLTAMKELPATLLLKPSEFTTLATHIWSVQDQGYFGFAAVPALVLLVISGVSMLVLLKTEGGDVG
jgi:iron(III) transport system permease protein